MQTLESIPVKMLNRLKKTDPKIYNDLISGGSINFELNTGHQVGTSGGQTSGTQSGIQKKTWNDFSYSELKAIKKIDPEFFDSLFEAEREKILKKYNL